MFAYHKTFPLSFWTDIRTPLEACIPPAQRPVTGRGGTEITSLRTFRHRGRLALEAGPAGPTGFQLRRKRPGREEGRSRWSLTLGTSPTSREGKSWAVQALSSAPRGRSPPLLKPEATRVSCRDSWATVIGPVVPVSIRAPKRPFKPFLCHEGKRWGCRVGCLIRLQGLSIRKRPTFHVWTQWGPRTGGARATGVVQ